MRFTKLLLKNSLVVPNTLSVKFGCILVELNFLIISRNAQIVWKAYFLYSSTIANTFGVVVCLISIMDTSLLINSGGSKGGRGAPGARVPPSGRLMKYS